MEHDEAFQQEERYERNQRLIERYLRPRLERVDQIYRHAVNSLWIGNGGATLATLSFIAGTWRQGLSNAGMLWPLGFFLAGLICMGAGSLLALVSEGKAIKRISRINSLLDMRMGDAQHPEVEAGLTFRDRRTLTALASGALFIIGCAVGFIELFLALHAPH